jgi:hypothetical protein
MLRVLPEPAPHLDDRDDIDNIPLPVGYASR